MITWQESNIERPKSLVQIAADAIRRGIILRELVMGQPLTEAGLAKTLGISKTPVREGLSLLRSEGLVVAEPHRGYRVFSMTQEELVDFCELRFALESQALRYAAQRQPSKLAKQLQQILTEMEDNFSPENREKYLELDTNFHKSFFRCAESRFLLQHYENINAIIETVRHYISGTDEATGNAYEDHKKITECLINSDLLGALEHLEAHIVNWSKRSNLKANLSEVIK